MSDEANLATDIATLKANTLALGAAAGAYLNDTSSDPSASERAFAIAAGAEAANLTAVGSDLYKIMQNNPTAEMVEKYSGILTLLTSGAAMLNDANDLAKQLNTEHTVHLATALSFLGDAAATTVATGRVLVELGALPEEAGLGAAAVGLGGAATLIGGSAFSAAGAVLTFKESGADPSTDIMGSDIVVTGTTITYSNGLKGAWSDAGDDGNGNATESTYQTWNPSTHTVIGSVTVPIADKQALSSGGMVITVGDQQEVVGANGSLTHVEAGTPSNEASGMQRVFTTAGDTYVQNAKDGEVDISGKTAGDQEIDFNGATTAPYQASESVDTSETTTGTHTNINFNGAPFSEDIQAQTTAPSGVIGKVDNIYSPSGQFTQSTGSIDGVQVAGGSAPLSVTLDGQGGLTLWTAAGPSDSYASLVNGQQSGSLLNLQGSNLTGSISAYSGMQNVNFLGNSNTISVASNAGLASLGLTGTQEMVTTSNGTVNLGQNSDMNLAGSSDVINMSSGATVGIFGGSGITVNASNDVVNMGTGTQAVINGSGDTANLTGSSGFNVTMSNGNIGMWNGVQAYIYGSNNHMTESAGSDINIGGNNLNIDMANGSLLGLLGDTGVTVNATNSTINMATGTQATINGSGDTGNLTGSSGFNVSISNGTIGMWDGVQGQISGSNDHIVESVNSNLGLALNSSTINGSAGDIITVGGNYDQVFASNAAQVNFAWYTTGGVLFGNNETALAGTGTSASYAGNNLSIGFNGDPNGGYGATLITGGAGNIFNFNNAYQLNFAEGSTGGGINGSNNGVPLGTGVSVSASGNNNNYYFNGDPDGNSGINLTLNGTGLNASISYSTLIGGGGSSTNLTGIGDDFHLNGSNSSVTEISGDTVYIPAGEGNVNVYGSGLTIYAGSNDTINVFGDNDQIEGGEYDSFDVYGSYDDVEAYYSSVDFGGGDVGDDVWGWGDGGYGWGGYYGYGYGGWGYYGYGGYAFSKTTAINGSDIGAIAAHDAGLKNQADAITAQAARLQAGAAMGTDGTAGAVFEGPKWSSDTITWSLAAGAAKTVDGTPLNGQLEADVAQAFAAWAAASHLKFREVSDPAQADIRVGWNSFDTANSSVLGYTKLGGQNGEILPHVDITLETPGETALATDSNGVLAYAGTDTEFSQLLLHEIGHALGLADSSSPTSIMAAVMDGSNRTLDATDIAAIQQLYANGNSDQANNDPAAKFNKGKAVGGGSAKNAHGPAESSGVLGHGSDYRSHANQIIDAIAGFGAMSSGSSTTSVLPPTANHDNLLAAAA